MLDSAPFNTAGTSVPSDPGVVSAITAQSHELSCKSAGANFGRMQCQSRSSSVAFHLEAWCQQLQGWLSAPRFGLQ